MMKTAQPRACDVMQADVATLSAADTIETALALFEEAHISGAPVVSNGRLVGMLSLADISRPEHLRGGRIETERDYVLSEPVGEEETDEVDPEAAFYLKEDYSPALLGRELVGTWMSSGVVSVSPETPLPQVCEVMLDRQVHRVCVTRGEKLLGLISTFDVVRHVAGRKLPARRPGKER